MKTLIRGGNVITAADDYHADLLVEDEKIVLVGRHLAVEADLELNAVGKLVIPGGIDPHTHMELPAGGTVSSDDFCTGTIAAACGGTTTIVDFATPRHGESFLQALESRHRQAEAKSAIDYGFHLVVTDFSNERTAEVRRLVQEGVTSFKMFTAYPGLYMVDDATMYRAMKGGADAGALICVHAENGLLIEELIGAALARANTAPRYHAWTRPAAAEAEGVHRAIAIAGMAGSPVYIVHLSCSDALEEVRAARDRGCPVFGETCPQYLLLDSSLYEREGFEGAKWVLTPPLREAWNQERLWRGCATNDIQVVATDHCPFNFKGQKELGRGDFTRIPNGVPGVEHRLSLLYSGGVLGGKIGMHRFVDLTSTAAARLFGLFPRKGTIAVGSDADIVIFDPDAETTLSAASHHMNVDYSAYEGMRIRGAAETVLLRGRIIFQNRSYVGTPGDGQFLKRGCASLR